MILGITAGNYAPPPPPVPTEFVVGNAGTLYVGNSGGGSLTVDWGDGSPIETTTSSLTHTYSNSTFTGTVYKSSGELIISGTPLTSVISIEHGLSRISFYSSGMESVNLTSVPSSIPSSINSTYEMFVSATSFNSDISSWDVSNVTDMRRMFNTASSFNQDISSWNVSNVIYMNEMFRNTSFNQDISSWDVSNVTDMRYMFAYTSSFNQDISSWDVSNVTIMSFMFAYITSSFNQDLSSWCVSNITSKPLGFDSGATAWTLPRPIWGTCPAPPLPATEFVVGHAGMLSVASEDGIEGTVDWGDGSPLESFTVLSGRTHEYSNVSSEIVGKVYKSSGGLRIAGTPLLSIVSIQEGLTSLRFVNGGISSANLTSVPTSIPTSITSAYTMFYDATSFNQDISSWNVSNVVNMNGMFSYTTSFNQDISSWNVSNVNDMDYMFTEATSFNQDLSSWCVSNITTQPADFDYNTPAWTLPRPVWGTCPNG